MKRILIPLTGWIDVPLGIDFPDILYYAAYFIKSEWVMRGPFITEDRALESLQYMRHFSCKIIKYNLNDINSLMKIRLPKSTLDREIRKRKHNE